MQGFTLVDGIVLARHRPLRRARLRPRPRARSALDRRLGRRRVAGFAFAPMLEPLMRELPVLRDLLGTNCELGILAGFAAAFVVALVLVSLVTPLLAGMVQNSAVGPVDQGLGFLFGVARGVLLVVIALVVYKTVFGGAGGVEQIDESRSAAIFADLEARIQAMLPAGRAAVDRRPSDRLTQSCGARRRPGADDNTRGSPLYSGATHPRSALPAACQPTFDNDKLREECGVFGVIGVAGRRGLRRPRAARAAAPRPGGRASSPTRRGTASLGPPLRLRPRQLHLRHR